MDELKIRDAFESMGPDDQARQRMLANVLAAHVAVESAPRATRSRSRQPRRFSLVRYAIPIAACLILAMISPLTLTQVMSSHEQAPAVTAAAPNASASADSAAAGGAVNKDQSEAATPAASESMALNMESSEANASPTINSPNGGALDPTTEEAPLLQSEINIVAQAPDPVESSAAAKASPLRILIVLLPVLFCVIALALAFVGAFAWRRFKRNNNSRD